MDVPVARRNNQAEYRQATAFEALIGYLYISKQEERLQELLKKIIQDN